jgi:eukaryotic-like serine/threonine-protein kinase
MSVQPVSAFVGMLQQSGLLPPAQLDAMLRWPQVHAGDPRVLARELMDRDWLTPYQVNQLLQGRVQELVLGEYILLERLGEGGMGQVFKARHRPTNRVVALKLMRREKADRPAAVLRFLQEMRTASQLVHPHIVRAYGAGHADSHYFFAMEYVEGINLSRLVKQAGPLPVLQACDFLQQAAQGLQHAHEHGVVHRDIKPANLLVARPAADVHSTPLPRAVVKILDMGLARLEGPDDGSPGLTRAGAVIGSPHYMAPEQAVNASKVDIRADLYGLGCTGYFLLTGKAPFRGGSAAEIMTKQRFEEPTPIERLRSDVPTEVRAIVRKLMAKRPEDRYRTPAEVAEALRPFARRWSRSLVLNVGSPPDPRTPGAGVSRSRPDSRRLSLRKSLILVGVSTLIVALPFVIQWIVRGVHGAELAKTPPASGTKSSTP